MRCVVAVTRRISLFSLLRASRCWGLWGINVFSHVCSVFSAREFLSVCSPIRPSPCLPANIIFFSTRECALCPKQFLRGIFVPDTEPGRARINPNAECGTQRCSDAKGYGGKIGTAGPDVVSLCLCAGFPSGVCVFRIRGFPEAPCLCGVRPFLQ